MILCSDQNMTSCVKNEHEKGVWNEHDGREEFLSWFPNQIR